MMHYVPRIGVCQKKVSAVPPRTHSTGHTGDCWHVHVNSAGGLAALLGSRHSRYHCDQVG